MRTTGRLIAAVLALAGAAAGFANGADTPPEQRARGRDVLKELTGGDAATRTGAYASLLASFRDSAAEKPSDAVAYWFAPTARSQWNTGVAADMNPQQVADFFTGGILLAGGSDRKGIRAGVYNPWWDAILLVHLQGRETAATDEDRAYRAVAAEDGAPDAPRAQITEFRFLSGETFRGDPAAAEPSVRTVVPEDDPLAVELWRVAAGTRRRFEALFPLEGRNTWGAANAMWNAADPAREMERIQTRAALRLKLNLAFLQNARDTGIAAQVAELVRHGSHYRLCDHFTAPASRPLLRTLADMPPLFRKDFAPYGRVATAEATLFLFVNTRVPRLFATVTLPRDRTKSPPSLEWYDLLQADELLAVWNSRKEVSK